MIYLFENYSLDTDRRELRRGGHLVAVEPQVFDLLRYLICNRERVVSKDDLIAEVWKGRIVSESTLSSRITAVRHAVGDTGEKQRLVRTAPRKGYRFVGEVRVGQWSPDAITAKPAAPRGPDEAGTPLRPPLDAPADHVPKRVDEKDDSCGLVGERKHVTVLCADLKPSLELIAERDPEEALKILDAVVKVMTQAVHRYEGTVILVTGDGITALFGAPLAHEDHAVRACYAALQIREAVKRYAERLQPAPGAPILVRAGLNSGEVVTHPIASDVRREYRAMGQASRLAARLGQIAPPGTLLVSAETLRLAEGHVQVTALDPASTSGQGEAVYELVGAGPAQTRFQALTARGLTSFVGRSTEMGQLERVQARAQQEHGQVVTIIGEPGLGKSRLLHEYIRSHRTSDWLVLESASVSYRMATSYLPVIELLKTYFKIADSDAVSAMRNKVVERVLDLDRALAPDLTALLALLDIPVEEASWQALDSALRRQRTLDALKRLFLRESQRQPVIWAFEDLHWIDSESQAFLETLIDGLASAPLLLILTYRPEYEHHWGGKSYYTQVRLNALSPETTEEFLHNLVGDDVSLIPLKGLLPKHGNPFFLEESIRTLVETSLLEGQRGGYRLVGPVQELRIPSTVQAILAARIDRLPARAKRLLQAASIVGKEVPHAILQPIAGLADDELRRGLAELREAEFLYERRLFPDLEYTFKHALTHEVTYGSLLAEQRRALHRQIVDVMERLYPDRLTEYIEQLAHHAFKGEVWEKAVSYLRQAGAKAFARSAHREAATYLEQALAALDDLPETRETLEQAIDIRFDLRGSLTPLGGELEQAFGYLREAEGLARRLDDQRRLGWVWIYMSVNLWLAGHATEARTVAQRAHALAETLEDLPLRVAASYYLGTTCLTLGDHSGAEAFLRTTVQPLQGELSRERFGLSVFLAATSRGYLAWTLAERGEFQEGIAYGQEGVRMGEAIDHPYSLAVACWGLAHLYDVKGEFEQACPLLERALALAHDWNITYFTPNVMTSLGHVYAWSGRIGEGVSWLEQALASGESPGINITFHSKGVVQRGEAFLLAGRVEDARACADRALTLAREDSARGYEARALHLLGEIAAHYDGSNGTTAEAHYGAAIVLASELGMRPLVAHCHLGLGKHYRRTGEAIKAQEHLTTATAMYREMGMSFWLQKAEALG